MRIPKKSVALATSVAALGFLLSAGGAPTTLAEQAKPEAAPWSLNATIIEACSCQMFCPCYFSTKPAPEGHSHGAMGAAGMSYCRFNMGYKVNKGSSGPVKLDGAKFWIAGDLGADFSQGQMDWATLIFDKSLTPAQREAIGTVAGQLFPVKWNSFTTAEGVIDTWQFDDKGAVALLDGGKTAEIRLHSASGMNANEPVVLRNVRYWGAARNDGFVMMPNDVEAYRVGPKAYEYKGTNGFMITVDMNSNDVKAAAGM